MGRLAPREGPGRQPGADGGRGRHPERAPPRRRCPRARGAGGPRAPAPEPTPTPPSPRRASAPREPVAREPVRLPSLPRPRCRRAPPRPGRARRSCRRSPGREWPALRRVEAARKWTSPPRRPGRPPPLGAATGRRRRRRADPRRSDFPHAWYLRQVLQKVEAEWQRQNRPSEPRQKPLIYVEIQRDGSIKLPRSRRARATPSTTTRPSAPSWRRALFRTFPHDWTKPSLRSCSFDSSSGSITDEPAFASASAPAGPARAARSLAARAARSPRPRRPARRPPTCRAQRLATGAKKLNIVIPTSPWWAAPTPRGSAAACPEVTGRDLTFSASSASSRARPRFPPGNPAAVKGRLRQVRGGGRPRRRCRACSPCAGIASRSRCGSTT